MPQSYVRPLGSNGTVNRLNPKEAVRKYVRFLEPLVWQRQKPTTREIPVQITGSMNQSSNFFRPGELAELQSYP